MDGINLLLHDIQAGADERGPEVLVRLLAKYDEEDLPDVCEKHAELRVRYTMAAIAHHRLNGRWKRGNGDWNRVNEAYYYLIERRREYRNSVFHCGCSNKYDSKKKDESCQTNQPLWQ